MKKTIIVVILAIGVGLLLSKLIFSQYDNANTITVSNNTSTFYFIQLGAYSTKEEMINNTTKLSNYIYLNEDNLYYVFTCITQSENNLTKIEGYYKDNGYTTYRKEFSLSDSTLKEEIDKVDTLMSSISDDDSIKELCKQSIKAYKKE